MSSRLIEVIDFGVNPTGLRMHVYVPQRLAPRPALLVAVHNCTESGPAFFAGPAAEFVSAADEFGYLMVFPSATRPGACFDVSSPGALRRDGDSDPAGIAAMVGWARQRYDVHGVFALGLSSGAIMTHVLLGDYPDIFTAGAAFAGVPFAGFASDTGNWSEPCAQGRLIRTGRDWGDRVRSAFPDHAGPWPRIQLWHSTVDDILDPANLNEAIKQWTDVHDVEVQPALRDQPRPGWNRTRYGNASAIPPVEAISVQDSPHNVLTTGMARYTLAFFALQSRDDHARSSPREGATAHDHRAESVRLRGPGAVHRPDGVSGEVARVVPGVVSAGGGQPELGVDVP
jgi:acetylxylan esterase